MLQYLEYLKIPAYLIAGVLILLVIANIIGTILDLKGKVVPEFINARKYFKHKRAEKEALRKLPQVVKSFDELDIAKFQATVNDFNSHYSMDNIQQRNSWMDGVNQHIHISEPALKSIKEDILEIKIENMRSSILDFAGRVVKEEYPATREQFNRIFKQYAKYEKTIEENNLTNGEVDVAHRIIQEAYETRLRDRSFIEDIRGYGVK